ncbi:MAG: flagellar hook protein FlgE [Nitrospinota bacterium]
MSLSSSLYAGVGGLLAYGDAMNVIGDNIANVNTVGFKGSRAIFGDILAGSISSTKQIGRGSTIREVSADISNGSLQSTNNSTDVALQGSGYFIMGDQNSRFYTRAGQFTLNEEGLLQGATGLIAQGFQLDRNGNRTGSVTDINLAGVQSAPRATATFTLGANLDAAASAATTFQSTVNVNNSLGELVTLGITFTKSATAGTWTFATSATTTTGTALSVANGTGTLTFDSSGTLTSPTTDPSFTISGFTSGAADLTTAWDIVDANGVTEGTLTNYASPSVTNSLTQDGFATGVLKGITIDSTGVIVGLFSNGQTQGLMQLAVADFLSPWGLTRQGNTLYSESANSGQPIFGTAGTGGFGTIVSSSLEQSNIDLGTEFVNLIQTQRAYQANSRIITSVDEMMAEAVNLKR